MSAWLQLARWQDAIDVATVAVLAWFAIRFLRRTRARPALLGLAVLGAVYAAATWLGLRLTASLFQAFFAAVVIILVVVFQEDLRRFFEQLGSWRPGRATHHDPADTISLLVRTAASLAEQRTGALIVLPQTEPIDRHVEGGVLLSGRASEPLLLSIFDSSSPGHDGAVVMRGAKVERFAAHLPLSANRDLLGQRGTRHAAALGLAERCDAICIVVSEERGTISIARDGNLQTVAVRDLAAMLTAVRPEQATSVPVWRRGAWLDAGAAILGALLVWLVFVPGSDVSDLVVPAKVEVSNLPEDLALNSVDPTVLEVTLRGQRRDLILVDPLNVAVQIDAYLARVGRRTFSVSEDDIRRPDTVSIVSITPQKVRLDLAVVEASEGP